MAVCVRQLYRMILLSTIAVSFAVLLVTLVEIGELLFFTGPRSDTDLTVDDYSNERETETLPVVPMKPFVENEPKSVIVLTYQRSGSSFFGQMFNSNPNAFYMFEPIDSLYCALYGTNPGWNIPSDITTFWNGTQRILPDNEAKAVASFLGTLFSCNIDAWPTETLAHRYWTKFGSDHAASADYVQCLRLRNFTMVPACHVNTEAYCGRRFGEKSPSRIDECNRLLWSPKYLSSHPSPAVRKAFGQYRSCQSNLRKQVERNCVSKLKKDCSTRHLRAVKTVRATMDSMEPLLQKFPNFRIIHMTRDPRAVALSRSEFDNSGRGQFSIKAGPERMTTEAMLYCRTAARDIRIRRSLEARYPGRIYSLMYDDVVRDLTTYTKLVYRFIDEPVHPSTLKWIATNARRKRNSTSIATRWQNVLTVNQNERILAACSELFTTLKTRDSSHLLV